MCRIFYSLLSRKRCKSCHKSAAGGGGPPRRYADIQFLFEGNEAIGWRPLTDDLAVTQPYSEQDDIGFVAGEGTAIPFVPGGFFVLFPQDAHAPGQRTPAATRVKKAIVKVLL